MPSDYAEDDEALLFASRKAYKSAMNGLNAKTNSSQSFTDGADLLSLDSDPMNPPKLDMNTSATTKSKDRRKSNEAPDVTYSLQTIERGAVEPKRKRTKQEIQEYKSKSSGSGWYDMPAFAGARYAKGDARLESGKARYTGGDARAATEKEMRRQITAIRLRNALDPKRFYRGGSGTGSDKSIPKFAQLGTMIGGGLEPKSIVPRKERADSVVGELVNDAKSVSYAKKKFNEHLI
ncbi:dTDP-fucopyranose mutase [Malassezia yamatoensis]|uniref:dTDP-fucopyranose mutase n=1 Tax=Malassezia yamatoensis TaxID=253288 RepID=A0AAJ5YSW1_9BASI|nr:dTDP-fucopyranose mutase [Malassezia yamatoensis]